MKKNLKKDSSLTIKNMNKMYSLIYSSKDVPTFIWLDNIFFKIPSKKLDNYVKKNYAPR